MINCLNLNLPQIQEGLSKLTDILGDANAAHAVLALNNGYNLEKTPNGLDSKLFLALQDVIKTQYPEMTEEDVYRKVFVEKARCYSPNFLEWFGDWINDPKNASKVVDENGEPLVVWHKSTGDNNNFDIFDLSKNNQKEDRIYSPAYHFGTKKAAELVGAFGGKTNLRSFFLSIKNPDQLEDFQQATFNTLLLYFNRPDLRSHNEDPAINRLNIIKNLFAIKGHDGYSYINTVEDIGSQSWAIFDSSQAKSAINNNGLYKSNSIYGEHEYQSLNRKRDDRLLELYHKSDFLSHEAKWKKIIEDIIQPSPYRDLIQLLASFSSVDNRFLSEINIKFVDHLALAGPTSVLQSKGKFQGKRAYYDASTSTIYIDVLAEYNNGDSASVLMHEIMHGITISRIVNNEALKNKFLKILNLFKKFSPGFYYPSFDEHALEEFIADIWTNPEIIELLKQIPATKKSNISLWQRIVKFFLSVLFSDIHDGSLFQEASTLMVELLESVPTEEKLYGKYYESSNLSQDTKDILALQQYLYSIEGLTPDEISERHRAYLNEDKDEIRIVRKMIDLIQIRQALLHVLGRDFGLEAERNGYFDWDTYLKGVDLRHEISDKDDLSEFPIITNYTVDPAEIVMPKLYKSQFKIGTHDIAEIDVNYFKRANPYYYTHLKDKKGNGPKMDVLVRTHTSAFNVIISDSLLAPMEGMTKVDVKIENGWRVSDNRERMYKIPEGLNYIVYKDTRGQETLCILQSEYAEKQTRTLISTTQNLVSIQLFAENIQPSKEWISFTIESNNIKTNNGSLNKLLHSDLIDDEIRTELKNIYIKQASFYKNDLANTLYNSFVKSLYLISVRIPTQAFQSIMAVKVAGLTNDDSNNVFVTRWLFWLLGSKQYYL